VDTEEMVALAAEFAELAAEIRNHGTETAPWRGIGQLAVEHVPGCTWASVSDLQPGRGRSFGASDPVAAYLDQLQFELGEGPCLHSVAADASVLSADLRAERRWPRFVRRACAQTPLRSVLAIRLPGREASAMTFYARQPAAFDDASVAAASILAAHAAGLLVVGETSERSRNLEIALRSNRQIGMAIGVLMAHHKITEEEAFTLLRVASQSLHRKLRDIASDVARTGTLPDLPHRTGADGRAKQISPGANPVGG
jgi:hypothetical protein